MSTPRGFWALAFGTAAASLSVGCSAWASCVAACDTTAGALTASTFHWNGTSWSAASNPVASTDPNATLPAALISSGWSASPSDAWMVGSAGALLHWDGTAWSSVPGPSPIISYTGVWGFSGTDVFAIGNEPVTDAGATPPAMVHWNGSQWASFPLPLADGGLLPGEAASLWGSSANDLWFVAGGEVMHWNGQVVTTEAAAPGMLSIWGSNALDIWLVGNFGISHWNGSQLTPGLAGSFASVYGSATDDVWAVGKGVQHWNGTSWNAVPAPSPLDVVWAVDPTHAWASGVGAGGALFGWDGTRWSAVDGGTSRAVDAIWGSSPTDVWVQPDELQCERYTKSCTPWFSCACSAPHSADAAPPTGLFAVAVIWMFRHRRRSTPETP